MSRAGGTIKGILYLFEATLLLILALPFLLIYAPIAFAIDFIEKKYYKQV